MTTKKTGSGGRARRAPVEFDEDGNRDRGRAGVPEAIVAGSGTAAWEAGPEFLFRAFRAAAQSLTGQLDLRLLIPATLDAAMQATGAERGALFHGREDGSGLLPVLARNIEAEEFPQLERLALPLLEATPGVVSIPDTRAEGAWRELFATLPGLARCVLCAPVTCGRTGPAGVLYLDASRPGVFSGDHTVLVRALAELAAQMFENARNYSELSHENARVRYSVSAGAGFGRIIASHAGMQSLLHRAEMAAHLDVPALIVGEPGTGRELLARALHDTGPRALQPFLVCDCGAFTDEVLEPLLFGRGRPDPATGRPPYPGLLVETDRGTLYLRDVERMHPELQRRLDRSLAALVTRPAGGRREFRLDLRVLLGTAREPADLLAGGLLDVGLYRRARLYEFRIPPLRSRAEDIPELVGHFVRKHAGIGTGEIAPRFTAAAIELLRARTWPGNVRELEDAVRRVLLFRRGDPIDSADLTPFLPVQAGTHGRDPVESIRLCADEVPPMIEWEREAIRSALRQTRNNRSKAAKVLGVHRNTLIRKMRQMSLR